jgi:PAS domain S-box-containing protein
MTEKQDIKDIDQWVEERTSHLLEINQKLKTEIAERRRAEEALRESEERYRLAVEHSNDGFALSEQGRIVYVNQRFMQIFGYRQEQDVIDEPISSFIHPDDRQWVEYNYNRRQRGEAAPSRYEFKGICKDGCVIYIEVSSTKSSFHGRPVNLAYLRDITDRKLAEEGLRKSEAKYRNLFENTGTATFVIDENMTIAKVNAKCLELSGYTREEIEGKMKTVEFVAEQDLEKV